VERTIREVVGTLERVESPTGHVRCGATQTDWRVELSQRAVDLCGSTDP
jgi:hypothetical protein